MSKFILSPGPTQCKPEFLETLSLPMMYHRCSNFHELYKSTRSYLREIVGTKDGEIFLLTSSGTGAMEASVTNFFSPDDHVLVISIGNFGNRFVEICKRYHLNVDVLEYPLGKSYDLDQVKAFIDENSDLKGVFLTHHETSSGVVNDVQAIGQLTTKLDDCVFVCDSISGLLAHEMKMDDWHVDVVLAGSQKGFLIPPGISIAAISQKAVNRMKVATCPRFYFDLQKYLDMQEIDETPFTPNVSLILALNQACKYLIEDVGLQNYIDHHVELRNYLAAQLQQRNLDINFVDENDRGNVLVAVRLPKNWNAKVIHDALDEKGYIIATGFGEYKTSLLRIAVIGHVCKADIDKFLAVFDQTIEELYR